MNPDVEGSFGPVDAVEGVIFHDLSGHKDHIHNGEKWVEVTEKSKNTFGFRDIYSQGSHVYMWQVVYNGEELSGSSDSVGQAYRHARKAVRRYRKMQKFLDKGK